MFIINSENDDALEEIASMPGVSRFGINRLRAHLEPLVPKGLSSLLLFGVIDKLPKVSAFPSVFNSFANFETIAAIPSLFHPFNLSFTEQRRHLS